MLRIAAPLLLFSLSTFLPAQADQPETTVHYLIVAEPGLADELLADGFEAYGSPTTDGRHEHVQVFVPPDDHARFVRATGHLAKLELRRGKPFTEIRAERQEAFGTDVPDPGYHSLNELLADVQALADDNPGIVELYDFQSRYGTPLTIEGRSIPLLRISDNPDQDEDEPNLVLFTNNHCRELNTIEVSLFAAEKLVADYGSDPEITALIDENQIWVIPSMNPDGLAFVWSNDDLWRKNRRNNGDGTFGVDLNRNYPFFWAQCGSSTFGGSNIYHGPGAASEPPTQAMLAFAETEGLERLLDIHSFSRDVRTPFNSLIRPRLPLAVTSFYNPMHSALATAMQYVTNTSCCCGTHMEWHQNTNGTMAFLVEMGTAFAPPIEETDSEVSRIWPGVRLFLTKDVPMRGHVRSLVGGTPVDATITIGNNPFIDGQTIRSFGRHGRYSMWIGSGNYDLTFNAPGYKPLTINATLPVTGTLERDVALEPLRAPTSVTSLGTPNLGASVDLQVTSPDDGGQLYWLAVSSNGAPSIPLLDREVPLGVSPLLANAPNLSSVFTNLVGTLDGIGSATAQMAVPDEASLIGFDLYFSALTIDPDWLFGIAGISPQLQLTIQP